MLVQRKFKLPESYVDRTIELGQLPYSFKDGEMTLICPSEDMELHERFLFRNWEVTPDGECEVHEDDRGFFSDDLQGSQASDQTANSGGNAETNGQNEGTSDPNGDGHEEGVNEKLRAAVARLDPKNNQHWIKDGRPSLEAVASVYGSSDVTRADVDAVAPGFKRGDTL